MENVRFDESYFYSRKKILSSKNREGSLSIAEERSFQLYGSEFGKFEKTQAEKYLKKNKYCTGLYLEILSKLVLLYIVYKHCGYTHSRIDFTVNQSYMYT